jgi:hypothetical protein
MHADRHAAALGYIDDDIGGDDVSKANGRTPPNDEGAERALIGHTLSMGRIPEAAETLAPSDFYQPVNETIWAALRALASQQKPCDVHVVRAYLQERGKISTNSHGLTPLYLTDLLATPSASDPAYIVAIIRDRAKRREVIELAQRVQQRAHESAELDDQLQHFEDELTRIRKHQDQDGHGSWWPIDLGPALQGNFQRPEPTIGERTDGRGMFYERKSHTVFAETEAGKTWLALKVAWDEMINDRHVVFLDFEDDENTITSRLKAIKPANMEIGMDGDLLILSNFHYIKPEGDLRQSQHRRDLAEVMRTYPPRIVFADGTTEAMAMHNLNPLDNVDIALFNAILVTPLLSLGAAVACLDHVIKDKEGRGRYALGGVHKLNAISGAGYLLESVRPFSVGIKGRSRLKITKDRPGALRSHGLQVGQGLYTYGDLVMDSHNANSAKIKVWPPMEHTEEDQQAPERPEAIMKQISDLLQKKGPMSGNAIRGLVKGRNDTISAAVALLISEGYITKSPHAFIKAYSK